MNDVVQLPRPGSDNPGDDSGEAATAGEVEFGSFMKADANPVGDGSGHGASSGKRRFKHGFAAFYHQSRFFSKLFSCEPEVFVYCDDSVILIAKRPAGSFGNNSRVSFEN